VQKCGRTSHVKKRAARTHIPHTFQNGFRTHTHTCDRIDFKSMCVICVRDSTQVLKASLCLLDGQVSLKPGKHRCNQACDFSTDTRERLDVHLCIEHDVFRTKCEQCDYSSEYPCVLKSHVQSVHEKIRHKCNLCERTYATKAGVRRHFKNVHGPTTQTETSEADTNSSTDENDRDCDNTDDNENSTDEDSDTIGEPLETSSDKEDQMKTSTPAPNACDIES
jgi:hypothetical protein